MSIILDSQKIINDNFRSRITVIKGKNEFNFLSKLLNQILNSLAIQKNKLIKAKETINLRRKFTEKIINEVSNGIIYLDTNEKVLLYNRRSQEIFGKNFKEDFLKKNSQISQFIRKFKEDDTFLNEIQLKYVSQKKIKILNFKLSKVFEKKKFKGMILSINDITELVSAQKNAAWSNVARYMAHEIKNPLTPIKLSAQRISHSFKKNRLNESSSLKSCTETIIRQVSNIEKLVSEFSNFARMPEGNFEPIKLNNLIETQLNTQKIVNNDTNFKLISNNKQIEILCDYDQISRLFMNILKNSVESSAKKKKEVLVSLNKKGKFVIIDIEDNGDGFEENNRENFFEPYMTKKINGTGLGLAICKKIVEDHNGQIELLDSKLLGGAMVRIKLFTKIK
jgi:two-component system nitrogen regulation sensor histidine kinase NtrY